MPKFGGRNNSMPEVTMTDVVTNSIKMSGGYGKNLS